MVKISLLLACVATVVVLFEANAVSASTPLCYSPGNKCPTSPSTCCSGCCKDGVCIEYDTDPDHCSNNPCARVYCPPGEICEPTPMPGCTLKFCPGTCVKSVKPVH
ncbi:uncharacterized protein [Periplaneta americana]|uniref:uncharacterized protein n=1 Tax=Periplaneta americana TaxID=6978 RepID=UPI0037E7192C